MAFLLTLVYCSDGAVVGGSAKIARRLGGYERLLSRKVPEQEYLSLSHGSAIVLNGVVAHEELVNAVAVCMEKHPLLRSYISAPGEAGNPKTGGEESWLYCKESTEELAKSVVTSSVVQSHGFKESWTQTMQQALNDVRLPLQGPQWRVHNIISTKHTKNINLGENGNDNGNEDESTSAWVFELNHGADDQGSVHVMVSDLLEEITIARNMNKESKGKEKEKENKLSKENREKAESFDFPPSMEQAVAGGAGTYIRI